MARIPDDELERIKRETDLVALVRAKGVELRTHGADLIGLCPLHEDHEPSLVVTPGKNLWHCLGACQRGGSVIDWVMATEGVSFRHAVEILRGGDLTALAPVPVKRSTVPKLPCPVSLDVPDAELLAQVIDYYHATLLASPPALEYLKKRGLDDPEAIDAFRLGFADRTLGLRLPQKNRKEGEAIRQRLHALGILRDSGHEHLAGCLVIPILSPEGEVLGAYGRKLLDHLRPGTAYHLYLPGPHRGVLNLPALRASKEIILCEALIDALTFWCAGFRNVTSAYGVNGFTDEILEAMKAHGTERALLAYDRDDAGDAAAEVLAKRLATEGVTSFRVLFPRGMDANDYACKVQPASQSLAVLLRSAPWMAGPLTARAQGRGLRADALPPTQQTAQEPPPSLAAASPPAATEPPATGDGEQAAAPEPASPVPPAPRLDVPTEVSEQEVVIRLGDRRYRIRGLAKNTSFEQLRVNVFASRDGEGRFYHVDTFDLYSARQRALFTKQAAVELGLEDDTVKKDLGKVLFRLEELQAEQIKKTLEPQQKPPVMSEEEKAAALELLRDPSLLDRIVADFQRCGVVGEPVTTLVGYLAAVSRKLDEPLAVILQSSSAAGKSALMHAILAMVPEEERVHYSAMTGQSLFYMGSADLKHKILAIAEEEGAERASYALKLLQSEGELTIASTGKDPQTGRLLTHEYRVEGPVMIVLTTTAIEIDEELLNRCLVLTVNEEREQTRAIHRLQRERQTLEGLLARQERKAILALHRNAQRLLHPVPVVNPYARELTFLDDRTRTRRDHLKYLHLIEAIALLHQYQRELRSGARNGCQASFLEVTLDDIAVANRLAHEVLGRSLDELPPQTRRFLTLLDRMVAEACQRLKVDRADYRFSRAEARTHLGWSYAQVRAHLDRLVELEYVLVHRGGRGQSFVYELLYDGKGHDGRPHLSGLLDVESLRKKAEAVATIPALRGPEGRFEGPLSGHCAPIEASLRLGGNGKKPNDQRALEPSVSETLQNAHLDRYDRPASYAQSDHSSRFPPLAAPAASGNGRER